MFQYDPMRFYAEAMLNQYREIQAHQAQFESRTYPEQERYHIPQDLPSLYGSRYISECRIDNKEDEHTIDQWLRHGMVGRLVRHGMQGRVEVEYCPIEDDGTWGIYVYEDKT